MDENVKWNHGFKIDIDKHRVSKRVNLNNRVKNIFAFSTLLVMLVLVVLLYDIIRESIGWLNWEFLMKNLSIFPEKAGIRGAILGTLYLMVIVIPVTLILGVATAIFIEEYAKDGLLQRMIRVNISNLASVPSVIFGLLGLTFFSRVLGLGSSILAGAHHVSFGAAHRGCGGARGNTGGSHVLARSFLWNGGG